MRMCLFLLDPPAFTSNKQVGLENKGAKSMRDGKIYQFFQSKPPALAGFGASLVLSTIVLPVIFVPFRLITNFKKVESLGPKNPTDVEYLNTCNTYRIYDLNIRDCRY